MAWPTDDLTTTHYDAGTDDPSQARSELIDLKTKLSEVIAGRATANGVCDLDGSGKVPVARFPAAYAKDTASGVPGLDANGDLTLQGFDVTYDEQRIELGGDYQAGEEILLVRTGNVVTVGSGTAALSFSAATNNAVSTTGIIPSAYRPTSNVQMVAAVTATVVYQVTISAAGTFQGSIRDWTGANANSTFFPVFGVGYLLDGNIP